MPLTKITFNQPILLNKNYIRSIPGILKCVQCLLGFISFMTIWLTCRSNYDPYLGTYSGFVGGDLETFTLLIYFESFSMTLLLLTTYYFSIVASTFISKTVFEFIFNTLVFTLQFIISFILFITLLQRNQNDDGFPFEPGFAGKLTSSIFGLINSIVYLVEAWFSYKSYVNS